MLIRPPRLNYGDTVGIVAPASPPADPKIIDRCVAGLERLGFKSRLASHARHRCGFLAGTDRERATDLMKLFADPQVKAIFCVRGGYGAARLLPLLNYRIIHAHPKIFVGYSDITSLHCALLVKAGLISFHGPMLSFDFAKDNPPTFTRGNFLRTLMNPVPPGSICRSYGGRTVRVLRDGTATGQLVGGNLSVLCTTLATPFQPSFAGKILFLEDVGEAPYRFDRMLTHLLNAGLLAQVAGIAIGINKNCKDPNVGKRREFRQTVDDVIKERLLPLKIPVVTGLPFGHLRHNATLPVGARASLDGNKGDLQIIQGVVS